MVVDELYIVNLASNFEFLVFLALFLAQLQNDIKGEERLGVAFNFIIFKNGDHLSSHACDVAKREDMDRIIWLCQQ